MNTVNNNGMMSDLYWQEEQVKVADGSEQKLSQEDFFSLLTEQLAHQDPSKPVDNDQMVAQMTSFSMAEGITDLNQKFSNFAASMTSNQALQASSLIGQNVLVEGNVGYMQGDGAGFSGVVVNDQSVQDMKITVSNQYGEIVKTIDAGTQAAGNIQFQWDGTDTAGNPMPAGEYVVSASGVAQGEGVAIATAVNRHVGSVSLAGSGQGVILNLDGDVSISLDDVIQIGS
ncbi:flagellar hook assembly protein FlgD [Salinimonas marina]|uniref:Basal-body rod modification protein FlgD n=1 Tax=Salinimonas marina TaxID=2785918 RepID=A0A7S9DVZ5_9ALTE|nr:flagellar hook assembly protein FlgD [Salinimonas marina]QPG04976.1 flagellar hook assembly protein FlgD [Salinimonas marina]